MAESKNNSSTGVSMDTELGRLVIEQNLATDEEVKQCLSLQSKLAEQRNQQSLAEVLVTQGVVTARQIGRVKATIEETHKRPIPGYQILSKLGSGAMATVLKGKQLSLDRLVAIKILPPELSQNA
ncbi:MAG: serine/threonine protein kinase, partial [Phycisphaerae bacterium]|nr:serine/threonine protein kinase [Phycisphaerae bacterium]